MHDWSWQWWINIQTLPGNIVPDVLLGIAGYLLGKYHEKRANARERRAAARDDRHHKALLEQADRHQAERLAQAADHHSRLVEHLKVDRGRS